MQAVPSGNEIRFDRLAQQIEQWQLLVDDGPAKLGARAFDVLAALIGAARSHMRHGA